ncbi:MAG TPA: hypothetical protein VL172_16860 [Kofleriaceae bacterium]|jgi:hypothetical protein|nr:hypothetical protein [Kofleriaceae bacterium]
MRTPALLAGLLLAVPATAAAAPVKNPDKVDIAPIKADVKVLSDGRGHYVVVRNGIGSVNDNELFYGDGKTFYAQRIFGGGGDGSTGRRDMDMWEPRSRPRYMAELEHNNGVWTVTCDERDTTLNEVPHADAVKILDKATFYKVKWKRRAYALARDEFGVYYYVDQLREEFGGKGFELYVGPRGNMVKQKMINIVSDSMGDIFATAKGDLRLILDKSEANWVKGKKRTQLTYVPPEDNAYMIYAELGVYNERLGTPCDDL